MNRLSTYLTALTLLPMALAAAEPDAVVRRLEELGRIAAVMVDATWRSASSLRAPWPR